MHSIIISLIWCADVKNVERSQVGRAGTKRKSGSERDRGAPLQNDFCVDVAIRFPLHLQLTDPLHFEQALASGWLTF
jgi:hypothetical protein